MEQFHVIIRRMYERNRISRVFRTKFVPNFVLNEPPSSVSRMEKARGGLGLKFRSGELA
jgi:hypothetical protein